MDKVLNGKNVAIVGNAQSLFNYDFGREIDSHEVIIRINRSASLCFTSRYRTIHKTHGTKTTIWAFSFADTMKAVLSRNFINVNYLIQMNDRTKNKIEHKFNFDAISSSDIMQLKERLNQYHTNKDVAYGPSTGLRVLDFVSKFQPQTVNVYGFDWKETPTFYDVKKSTRFTETKHNHNFDLEMRYCKEIFQIEHGFNFKGVSL